MLVNACSANPCRNSAVCLETIDDDFECFCRGDFSGPRCEGLTDCWLNVLHFYTANNMTNKSLIVHVIDEGYGVLDPKLCPSPIEYKEVHST